MEQVIIPVVKLIMLFVIIMICLAFFLMKVNDSLFRQEIDWRIRQIFFYKCKNRPVGFILGGLILSVFILGIPLVTFGKIPMPYYFFAISIFGFMWIMHLKSKEDQIYSGLQKYSIDSRTYSLISESEQKSCYNSIVCGIHWIINKEVGSEDSFKRDVQTKVASRVNNFLPSIFFTNNVLYSQSPSTITTLFVYNFKQNLDEAIETVSMRLDGLKLSKDDTAKVLGMFTDIKFLSFNDKVGLHFNLNLLLNEIDRRIECQECVLKKEELNLLTKVERIELRVDELIDNNPKSFTKGKIILGNDLTQGGILKDLKIEFQKALDIKLSEEQSNDIKLFIYRRFENLGNRSITVTSNEYINKAFLEANIDVIIQYFKDLPHVNPSNTGRKLEASERINKKDIAMILVDEFPDSLKTVKKIQELLQK